MQTKPRILNSANTNGSSGVMYQGAPWCLGRYDSFVVNQPQLITLLGHDYVIWKDQTGQLNAIDNICPHAGANLAQGYVVDFQGRDCLACPYHGNKVQFFGDGKIVVDGQVSRRAVQSVLTLEIKDQLVWTYGLNWQEVDGKLRPQPIEPKLPIPDYRHVPHLLEHYEELQLTGLNHIYSRSESVNCNLAQAIWNIHDGEHFAGTHRETMLSKEIKIEHLVQDGSHLSWQLTQYKRDDRAVRFNRLSPLVDEVLVQSFNTFVPSLAVVTLDFGGKMIAGIVSMYPESATQTRVCLDSFIDFEFSWWQKLIKLPQYVNYFRDRLIFEDMTVLSNLYDNFEPKITLKNDTPAQLAMDYLRNWQC